MSITSKLDTLKQQATGLRKGAKAIADEMARKDKANELDATKMTEMDFRSYCSPISRFSSSRLKAIASNIEKAMEIEQST